jgi:hypothetical protein
MSNKKPKDEDRARIGKITIAVGRCLDEQLKNEGLVEIDEFNTRMNVIVRLCTNPMVYLDSTGRQLYIDEIVDVIHKALVEFDGFCTAAEENGTETLQ